MFKVRCKNPDTAGEAVAVQAQILGLMYAIVISIESPSSLHSLILQSLP